MKKIILSLVAMFFLLSTTTPVLAQFNPDSLNPELGITLQPTNPQPGEGYTAAVNDYSQNSFGTKITWFIDGEKMTGNQNLRTIDLVASGNGLTQTIKAVLTRNNGTTKTLRETITPNYLDIIVEPQTHVPQFYQGRPLPSIGSSVNVTALITADNYGFRSTDLIYTWKINNKVIGGSAIRGKNQVSFDTPIGRTNILSLHVTEPTGKVLGERHIILPSVEPLVLFYESNALFGVTPLELAGSLNLIGNTSTVIAEPYYLDSRTYNNPDIVGWNINKNTYNPVTTNPYEISLQRNNKTGGVSTLSFSVQDTTQFLQRGVGEVKINF